MEARDIILQFSGQQITHFPETPSMTTQDVYYKTLEVLGHNSFVLYFDDKGPYKYTDWSTRKEAAIGTNVKLGDLTGPFEKVLLFEVILEDHHLMNAAIIVSLTLARYSSIEKSKHEPIHAGYEEIFKRAISEIKESEKHRAAYNMSDFNIIPMEVDTNPELSFCTDQKSLLQKWTSDVEKFEHWAASIKLQLDKREREVQLREDILKTREERCDIAERSIRARDQQLTLSKESLAKAQKRIREIEIRNKQETVTVESLPTRITSPKTNQSQKTNTSPEKIRPSTKVQSFRNLLNVPAFDFSEIVNPTPATLVNDNLLFQYLKHNQSFIGIKNVEGLAVKDYPDGIWVSPSLNPNAEFGVRIRFKLDDVYSMPVIISSVCPKYIRKSSSNAAMLLCPVNDLWNVFRVAETRAFNLISDTRRSSIRMVYPK